MKFLWVYLGIPPVFDIHIMDTEKSPLLQETCLEDFYQKNFACHFLSELGQDEPAILQLEYNFQ